MRLGDDPSRRVALAVLLVAVQGGMMLDYGAYVERQPTSENFARDYETYVGKTVAVGGTVVSTDPPVVVPDDTDEHLELEVRGLNQSVERGAAVSIYGTLQANHTVQVRSGVVQRTENRMYMYGISAVALLFVVGLGLRDWRFDARNLVFRNRRDD